MVLVYLNQNPNFATYCEYFSLLKNVEHIAYDDVHPNPNRGAKIQFTPFFRNPIPTRTVMGHKIE